MGTDNLEKVLQRLAVTDKTTLAIEKAPGGKVRVTSSAWADEKGFSAIRCPRPATVEGRLHVARKTCRHDHWDPPIEPYDPYVPRAADGTLVEESDT